MLAYSLFICFTLWKKWRIDTDLVSNVEPCVSVHERYSRAYFHSLFFCICTNLVFCRRYRPPANAPDGVFVWVDTLPVLGLCSLLFFVYMSVLQYRMLDPGHMVESVTVEEDPRLLMPVISVETSDDGTTRRTETTVNFLSNLTDDNVKYDHLSLER